jgi:REP element-mobilizing transposase RayT
VDLPKRKKIRLEGYDYSSCGAYFVTICITNGHKLLWENVGADNIRPNKLPTLSEHGKIVDRAISSISIHYENVFVDKYCIMPDHIHMIIFILPNENGRMISAPTLSTVIGQMKRWVSKQIGFSIWQKSFNDRIIHSEKGYQEVWKYIDENPLKWQEDEYYK